MSISILMSLFDISYESVGNESGPSETGAETVRRNYLREGITIPVPGVPIKGRTIWVIGSTLVVFLISYCSPERHQDIIKNKQCQCQPAIDLN